MIDGIYALFKKNKMSKSYRTPVSNKKRKMSLSSGVDALLGAAASSSGYRSSYNTGKIAGKLAVKAVKKFFNNKTKTRQQTGNTKVSNVRKGGNTGVLAGKIKNKGKTVNRSYNSLRQKGIVTREEFRFQDNIATPNESRLVGHMSLPIRATYYNCNRALLKCLFAKAGFQIPALTDFTAVKGFLKVSYFADWLTGTLAVTTFTIPGGVNPVTWLTIMDGFADWLLTFGSLNIDPMKIRWKSIEYVPETAYNSSNLSTTHMTFSQMYVTIHSKSMLKIQNQSGVYKGSEDDIATTDDVDNVPVELSTYFVTGNQFIHQNARTSATLGLGFLGFDQSFAINAVGSEPCPAYEILNCTNKEKITMDPGHIKTSIISYKKKLLFSQVLRMLVKRASSNAAWEFTDNSYIKSAGHCRALHVDRVIGASSGKVRLMGECELQQKVMVSGYLNTATDQYELQRS